MKYKLYDIVLSDYNKPGKREKSMRMFANVLECKRTIAGTLSDFIK